MATSNVLGWLPRMARALGAALRRCILGKSSHEYMNQFTRDSEYHRAQPGTLEHPAANGDSRGEFEPVHGWTYKQLDDYLKRNPAYRDSYEAELRKHAAPRG